MPQTNHYFVDEAGDLAMFDKRGRIIIGQLGVSRYFMVGVALIPNPSATEMLLSELRANLLSDPYFKGVPSMSPDGRKTASAFHASKDCPEVRRDVIANLKYCKAEVFAAIRRKSVLAQTRRKLRVSGRDVTLREIYDNLIARVFRDKLHKAEQNQIVFAKHPKWGRREAMALAIQKAQKNFYLKHGIVSNKPTDLISGELHEFAGLQVVDYYLWALQRLFERAEDRFFNLLAPSYRLIMDLDDKRNHDYGEYYSDNNPLELKRMPPQQNSWVRIGSGKRPRA